MKTVEEIISHLEMELSEAYELHDQSEDRQERLLHLIRAVTIEEMLDAIKN